MAFRCRACGGTYDPVLPDGMRYFHACADLSDAEVIAILGLPADDTTWTVGQRQAFERFPRTRPNRRNENVPGTTPADTGRRIADGLGVDPV